MYEAPAVGLSTFRAIASLPVFSGCPNVALGAVLGKNWQTFDPSVNITLEMSWTIFFIWPTQHTPTFCIG